MLQQLYLINRIQKATFLLLLKATKFELKAIKAEVIKFVQSDQKAEPAEL